MGKISSAGNLIICPECLRFRFSPIHGLVRYLGLCPGPSGGTLPPLDWRDKDTIPVVFYDANGHWRSKD